MMPFRKEGSGPWKLWRRALPAHTFAASVPCATWCRCIVAIWRLPLERNLMFLLCIGHPELCEVLCSSVVGEEVELESAVGVVLEQPRTCHLCPRSQHFADRPIGVLSS